MFRKLQLKRWQLWLLLAVALWMIYSGFTQIQRERKGQTFNYRTDTYAVFALEETDNVQRF